MYTQGQTIAAAPSGSGIINYIAALTRMFFGLTVLSQSDLSGGKARVFFSNHTSHVDFLLMWSSLPEDTRCKTVAAAAADYWCRDVVRRWVASSLFHAVMISRTNISRHNNPVSEIIKELDGGKSVIIFPEGGRNDGPSIGELKSGIYHIARKRPQIELIPVYIHNSYRILPKGEIFLVPIMPSICFGEPIKLHPKEKKKEFLHRARKEIERLRDEFSYVRS